MHFVFDHMIITSGEFRNLIDCPDRNLSGIRRFTPSPVVSELLVSQSHQSNRKHTLSTNRIKGQPYIIATGVAHAPWDWCGPDSTGLGFSEDYPKRLSLFSYIRDRHLKWLRSGKAYLLIDQSHEGYQTEWLWDWFHNNCKTYGIPPKQIIYVTGNLDSKDQYSIWSKDLPIENRMLIVPYPHFESIISNILNTDLSRYPTVDDHIRYKEAKLDNIKTYSALQKRARAHRAWFFKSLTEANLLNDGINSMNTFEIQNTSYEGKLMTVDEYRRVIRELPILPPENTGLEKFASQDCGSYLQKFNEQVMLDTWLTVVSEASFGDSENECFLSEKTFKPIACCHPFIIAGNKNSLYKLRELGYKTFSPFIDESYDNLSTWQRMEAIIKELIRINNMSSAEKLDWLQNMKPILEHNYNLLKSRSSKYYSDHLQVIEDYVDRKTQ